MLYVFWFVKSIAGPEAGVVTAARESRLNSIVLLVVCCGSMPPVGSCSGLAAPCTIVAGRVGRVTQQLVALVVDDVAFVADLELAVARVLDLVALVLRLEEAVAVDRQVQRVARGRDVALVELLRDRRHLHADAGLGVVGGRTRHRGGVHVGELRARRLLAEGVGVGDVVADHFEVLRSGAQAGQALLESHGVSPGGIGLRWISRRRGRRRNRRGGHRRARRRACRWRC